MFLQIKDERKGKTMSENTSDFLNDFLGSSEGNGGGGFADLPLPDFDDSVEGETKTETVEIPPESPKAEETVVQTQPQSSMFEDALKQTPAAKGQEKNEAATSFEDLIAKAQAQRDEEIISKLADKDAIFLYGSAKEPITDRECTFEDLREKYTSDFPELGSSDKVSWTVNYGSVTKKINNPGSDKVYEIKGEIEKSKAFKDGLKKAKKDADKNPDCFVKPAKVAGSKGKVLKFPAYKEFCTSLEDAKKSQKAIVVIPSKDGRLYQMRKTPLGEFIAPINLVNEFDEVDSGFNMVLPKIPMELLMFILNFFEEMSNKFQYEALVHILYDTIHKKYTIRVPEQEISHARVDSVLDEPYSDEFIHVMDFHSHNTMPAEFSGTDNRDEKETRLYAVAGEFGKGFPEIKVRAGCAGEFINIPLEQVFDINFKVFPHPPMWDEKIKYQNRKKWKLAIPLRTSYSEEKQ